MHNLAVNYWLGGWIRDRGAPPDTPLFVIWAAPWVGPLACARSDQGSAPRALVATLYEAMQVYDRSGLRLPEQLRVQTWRQQRIIASVTSVPKAVKAPDKDLFELMAEDALCAHA